MAENEGTPEGNAEGVHYDDSKVQDQINALLQHMVEEGESTDVDIEPEDAAAEQDLIYECAATLVEAPGGTGLDLVTAAEDWMHDAIDERRMYAGVAYSDGDPFPAGYTAITGYFQDAETGRWIRLEAGSASGEEDAWHDSLEEFPQVMAEYDAAMEVSEYRHMVEKAAFVQMAQDLRDE